MAFLLHKKKDTFIIQGHFLLYKDTFFIKKGTFIVEVHISFLKSCIFIIKATIYKEYYLLGLIRAC